MTIEALKSIRDKTIQIDTLKQCINSLEIDTDIRAIRFDSCKKSYSKRNSYIENRLIKHSKKLSLLIRQYDMWLAELTDLKIEANNIIILIPSKKQQQILCDRYMDALPWEEICNKYEYTDISSVYKLHKRGLESFVEVQG